MYVISGILAHVHGNLRMNDISGLGVNGQIYHPRKHNAPPHDKACIRKSQDREGFDPLILQPVPPKIGNYDRAPIDEPNMPPPRPPLTFRCRQQKKLLTDQSYADDAAPASPCPALVECEAQKSRRSTARPTHLWWPRHVQSRRHDQDCEPLRRHPASHELLRHLLVPLLERVDA